MIKLKTRTVSFTVDQIKIIGEVYFPGSQPSQPGLCLCHGIPADSYNAHSPVASGYSFLAQRFCDAGFVTLIFNFRGTGRSEGNLDILGWSRDLDKALDVLLYFKEVNKEDISVIGFSGGAAVAIYVAARDKQIARVVAGACPADFTSLLESQSASELIQRFRNIGVIRDKDFPPSLPQWLMGFEQISPWRWVAIFPLAPYSFFTGKTMTSFP